MAGGRGSGASKPPGDAAARKDADDYERPVPRAGADPIGGLGKPGRATVEGRVRSVEIRPVGESCVFACTVADSTGELTALFYGREYIPGIEPGAKIRLAGAFGIRGGHAADDQPHLRTAVPGVMPRGAASPVRLRLARLVTPLGRCRLRLWPGAGCASGPVPRAISARRSRPPSGHPTRRAPTGAAHRWG